MSVHPPVALDAELAVLSTALLKPDALDELTAIVDPSDFFSDANRLTFRAVVELHEAGQRVDVVTVGQRLQDQGRLAAVGGAAFLAQAVDATPAIANVAEHAALVAGKARQRRMISTLQKLAATGYSATDPEKFIDEVHDSVAMIADTTRSTHGPISARDAAREAYEEIAAEADGKRVGALVKTGLVTLDAALPMAPERMTVLAAGTGIGKTTLALQIAAATAEAGVGVVFVSLEMPSKHLAKRAMFQLAKLDGGKLRHAGSLTPGDWRSLADTATRFAELPITIDDREEQTPASIRASVRRARASMRRQGAELGLVVVDYLQLVGGGPSGRDSTREQQVSAIARSLKQLSRSERCHVLALAQLNSEADKAERPRMSHLRESKAVAMHSDNVILIHAPGAGERSDRSVQSYAPKEAEGVTLYIDKQRDGAPGKVELTFWPGQTLFSEPIAPRQARVA